MDKNDFKQLYYIVESSLAEKATTKAIYNVMKMVLNSKPTKALNFLTESEREFVIQASRVFKTDKPVTVEGLIALNQRIRKVLGLYWINPIVPDSLTTKEYKNLFWKFYIKKDFYKRQEVNLKKLKAKIQNEKANA